MTYDKALAAADQRYDFDAIFCREQMLRVSRTRHELEIHLHCDATRRHIQLFEQCGNRRPFGHFATFAVDDDFQPATSRQQKNAAF